MSKAWHSLFPSESLFADGNTAANSQAVASWFAENLPRELLPPPNMTEREKELALMSAAEFMAARKAGQVSCGEYARVLTARAEHYKSMNHFMFWDNRPAQMAAVVAEAEWLDAKAATEGVASLAPLYCLPVPLKGSMATKGGHKDALPSSCGFALLHDAMANKEAEAVSRLRRLGGVPFGKTNIPEWSASLTTCSRANGCTLNPYDYALIAGGSSGGAGSAVASYLAPVAFSEDTGGSTRSPALHNGNFGYDPSHGRYPNDGVCPMTEQHDQVGLNARTMEDVLIFDAAFLDAHKEHLAAKARAKVLCKDRSCISKRVRIGLPRFPFVDSVWTRSSLPDVLPRDPSKIAQLDYAWMNMRAAEAVMAKYDAATEAMRSAGATLVRQELPVGIASKLFLAVEMASTDRLMAHLKEYFPPAAVAGVSIDQLVADVYDFGGHFPHRALAESHPEALGAKLLSRLAGNHTAAREALAHLWNSYFDEHKLDAIMVPTHLCEPQTWECVAKSTCVAQLPAGSEYADRAAVAQSSCASFHSLFLKSLRVPKLVVPLGNSPRGHPVAVTFLGRAGHKGISAHALLHTAATKADDLDFLYAVNTVVGAIHAKEDLRRQPARMVQGEANLFPTQPIFTTPPGGAGTLGGAPVPLMGPMDPMIYGALPVLLLVLVLVILPLCLAPCCRWSTKTPADPQPKSAMKSSKQKTKKA